MAIQTSPARSQTASKFEYDAFISYRTNMNPDGPVGEELQKVLESYPVPPSLKQNIIEPKRFQSRLKVFRDTTDLSAGENLNEAIKRRLRVSRLLVVVCSPNTPRSTYCTEEVRYFEQFHGADRVLFLLIAGEPHESFPLHSTAPMSSAEAAYGYPKKEPLAADVRAADVKGILKNLRGRGIPKSKQARFKILAPLLGCNSPDDLIQRHRSRVRGIIRKIIAILLLVIIGVTWIVHNQIKKETIRSQAEQLLALMGVEEKPSEAEVDALWKLASSEKDVRLEFLKQAVRTHPLRFKRRAEMMVRAVMGIDFSMARAIKKQILQPLDQNKSLNVEDQLIRAFLQVNLPFAYSQFIITTFNTLLSYEIFHDSGVLEEDPLNVWNEGTTVSRSLAYRFWRRVKSLDEDNAKSVAESVFSTMKTVEDPLTLSRWASLLKEFKWLTPDHLRRATIQIMEKVQSQNSDSNQDWSEGILEPYAALWKGAAWVFSKDDVMAFAPLLINSLQATGKEKWRDELIDLLKRTQPNERRTATPFLLTAMKTGASVEYLDEILVKGPDLLTLEFRKQRVKIILDLITGDGQGDPELVRVLAKFPNDLSVEDLSRMQTYFLSAIEDTKDLAGNPGILTAIDAMGTFPCLLPPSRYWQFAEAIIKRMKRVPFRTSSSGLQRWAYEVSSNLPKPPAINSEGAKIYKEILEQIEKINLDKSFFSDRLHNWLKVLRALGGDLPVVYQEQLTEKILAKMAGTLDGSNLGDLIKAVVAIGSVSKDIAGKVVSKIIDVYENEPHQGVYLTVNLKDWRAVLSAADYGNAVRRIVGLMNRKEGLVNDLMGFLKYLSIVEEDVELTEVKTKLLWEIGELRDLNSLTKVRLRSLVQGRRLSTTDIDSNNLFMVLTERSRIMKLGVNWDMEFTNYDHERVLSIVISQIERATHLRDLEILQSIPFTLREGERQKVINAALEVFDKLQTEYETKKWMELL